MNRLYIVVIISFLASLLVQLDKAEGELSLKGKTPCSGGRR